MGFCLDASEVLWSFFVLFLSVMTMLIITMPRGWPAAPLAVSTAAADAIKGSQREPAGSPCRPERGLWA